MSDTSTVPVAPVPSAGDTPHDRRVFWLAVAIVVAVLGIVALLFFVAIPDKNKDVLNTVIGVVVGTGFGSVVGFYFGSSMSSKAKDETLANLSKQ